MKKLASLEKKIRLACRIPRPSGICPIVARCKKSCKKKFLALPLFKDAFFFYNFGMKNPAPYSAIFLDGDIAVLNKRAGLCVAADRFDKEAPRLDVLAQKELGPVFFVHRIDKETSGVIVYARNENAQKNLCDQFLKRKVKKTYHCLVRGRPLWEGNFQKAEFPLLPDGDARHRTVVNKKIGKKSETDFRLLCSCGPYSWIEAQPKTGRTHQIRAHLKALKFSIVCDSLYGENFRGVFLSELKRKYNGDVFAERPLLGRLALHAYKIEFFHPASGEPLEFFAPYPKDLEAARNQLQKLFGASPI